tara:strand:- start:76 stop:813 length:738 start_codon:yes stop_codon:yes gene_type:complete
MAFKMRSGNKVSFKSMGSSPTKQTDDGTIKIDTELDSGELQKRLADEKAVNAYLQTQVDSKKGSDEPLSDVRERVMTGKKTEKDAKKYEEGYRKSRERKTKLKGLSKHYADPTKADQIKSKAQIRADKKYNKELARQNDGKISKTERYDIKTKNLLNKYKSSQGSGKMGVSFNLKDALLGGQGIMGGFKYEPKRDILARKILKREDKRVRKEKVEKTRKDTKELREKRKPGTVFSRVVNKLKKKK